MEPNIPLLRKVMEHITEHPQEYHQRFWGLRTDCGTTHCIAGWALVFSGRELVWDTGDLPGMLFAAARDGLTANIAARELGLDVDRAWELFEADNSLDTVWALVEEISGGEVRRP